jgi:thiol-disulfide isomerase/thioredoxin
MVFLHIDTKNFNTKDDSGETPIDVLNKFITTGKKVFILIYMEGCGPCNATRPEWEKIKNVLKLDITNDNQILVVDIDKDLLDKVKNIKVQPRGFPTIRFISNKGSISEDFEDSKLSEEYKNRSIDSFVKWIHFKLNDTHSKVHYNNHNKTKRHNKSRKHNIHRKQKGGKWSLKYKRSINCKRPNGFSQKQYCKYSRRRH